jgi:hypothetical protein
VRRALLAPLAAAALALLPASASASALQPIHVINHAANQQYLKRVEAAALFEANTLLAPAWGTPQIAFRSYGWTITLEPLTANTFAGFHNTSNGQPRAVIMLGHATRADWTAAFAHELVEMLVDPYINRFYAQSPDHNSVVEVCDPVERAHLAYRGIALADFVLPAWYRTGTSGPWDYAQTLTSPLQYDWPQQSA